MAPPLTLEESVEKLIELSRLSKKEILSLGYSRRVANVCPSLRGIKWVDTWQSELYNVVPEAVAAATLQQDTVSSSDDSADQQHWGVVQVDVRASYINTTPWFAGASALQKALEEVRRAPVRVHHNHMQHIDLQNEKVYDMSAGGAAYRSLQHLANNQALLANWRNFGLGWWRLPADEHKRKVLVRMELLWKFVMDDVSKIEGTP